ncbi:MULTISPECIES: Hint domain-containing protein [unclassified Yoonia]|uniref:Hint domain-containing protein n=1 Tax=unclassified Yoonia TaxID=2629118 RepID=UPI002AFF1A1B|nr:MULTISPECIES: Hint domain-containing protein [unclassified Yoonia]
MTSANVTIDVFRAADMRVVDGVLIGETLSFADELVMDDVYALSATAIVQPLHLVITETGLHRSADAQNAVHLDCCLTLMASDGSTHDALVLVEAAEGLVAAVYLMALGDIVADQRYRLVGVTRQTATRRFAEASAGSFARGTRITMADGQMQPVEALSSGDLILTRDAGKQPLRQIAQATVRATGDFAPVVITKGTLHNDQDLVLRPDHRVFVYQRRDLIGAGRAAVLVKARHLVDGQRVLRRPGGFVDYFQLIFDDHQIIYAEGIAAESHLVDARTQNALPADHRGSPHRHRPHMDYEVAHLLVDPQQAAEVLRRASTT